ncbi:SDR family NAD(P)-dependent oxidoreductase [Cohnella herbarum]|uniref:Glucose 1-dehydrogenase n=1 Tax=Cohnella herbarum TaxID=2728023 RepID=A0A7Z2ZPP8_9BACL|nr:glucose 1-dehydrogenase [Cohnella herbarum]QJD87696.1 glucose 1-dehydrogenase [Cohnella herbarum]
MRINDKFRLDGRVSLVTGGGAGLGKAMAQGLAQAGSRLVIADIDSDAARRTAEEFTREGVEAIAVQADVTDQGHVRRMVAKAMDRFGRIDVLFNNAGISIHVPLEEMRYEDWQKIMNVNLNSVFLVSQEVGKVMIAQNSGVIVNISSMSGLVSNVPQYQAAYNTSKAAVIMLTKSMASEWAKYNIRVNTIAPGYMRTEMTAPYFEENGPMVQEWMKLTPMHRPGTPDELQGIAVFLASDASTYATGGVFVIDGGYTIL